MSNNCQNYNANYTNNYSKIRLYIESYTHRTLKTDSYNFTLNANKQLPIGKLVNTILIEYFSDNPVSEYFHIKKDINNFRNYLSTWINYAKKHSEDFKLCQATKNLGNKNIESIVNLLTMCQKNDISNGITDVYLHLSHTEAVIHKKEKSSRVMYVFTPNPTAKGVIDSILDYPCYPGDFISKVLDKYASLTYSEREKIYFNDTWRVIDASIKNKTTFIYKEGSTLKYYLPYKVSVSNIAPYNYILFKTWLQNSKKLTEPKLTCKRLLKINAKNIEFFDPNRNTYKITPADIESYEKMLKDKDIMFVSENNIEAKIRISKEGIRNYKSRTHMRPIPTKIEDCNDNGKGSKIYTFNCSESQLKFYFLCFGREAEVLEPAKLRETFEKHYRKAFELYHKQNT